MLRIRCILLGVAAMVFVGAFASASASAHTFLTCLNVGAGHGQWNNSACSKPEIGGGWETSEVANGTAVEGTSGVSKLKSKIAGEEIVITCKKDTFKGELEKEGKSKGEIVYEECSIANKVGEELSGCEVPNIKFKFKDLLVLDEVEKNVFEIGDEFKPVEEGKPFVTIIVKKKTGKTCLESGEFPVEGTQVCLLPEGTSFIRLHELNCLTKGSKLTLNKETATYEGKASIQLSAPHSGVAWAVS
jgi:hypothetical protein